MMDPTAAATTEPALARTHALASAFLASLPERPVSHAPSPEEMAAALDEALPETGSDPSAVLETGTIWNGRAAIRAAFGNWQATLDDVAVLQAAIEHVATSLACSR